MLSVEEAWRVSLALLLSHYAMLMQHCIVPCLGLIPSQQHSISLTKPVLVHRVS